MKTEIEARLLDINEEEFIETLKSHNATFVGDWFMSRNVYDLKPADDGKWMRLRTNGVETTLTIKEIVDKSIEGTKETEIVVSDFDTTNEILNKLGYFARGSQTNRRIRYILDDVEIDIDFWPMIPTYVEFEADATQKIKDLCKKLDIDFDSLTTMSVPEVYEHYGLPVRTNPAIMNLEQERVDKKY